jgi:hypothetical protein
MYWRLTPFAFLPAEMFETHPDGDQQGIAPLPQTCSAGGGLQPWQHYGASPAARWIARRFSKGVRSGTAHSGPITRTPASMA